MKLRVEIGIGNFTLKLNCEVELKVWDWNEVEVGGDINSDHWKWTGLKNVRYEVEK